MQTLSHHLLDILTNSVEAGATEIDLVIRESIDKDVIRFVVTDDGCGMDKTLLSKLTTKGISTKRGNNRGMGLYLLKEMIQDNEGTLQITSHNNKSTRIEWTIKHKKTNRIPLGDIAGVVSNFIYSYKDIDLFFTYQTDKDTFTFYLPAMAYLYKIERMEKSSDLKKLKKILEQNLQNINYNEQ